MVFTANNDFNILFFSLRLRVEKYLKTYTYPFSFPNP